MPAFASRLAALLVLLTFAPAASAANASATAEADAEMAAAIRKARDSLPVFWQVFRDRPAGVTGYALKVTISDANGTEAVWTRDIELGEGVISAVIDDQPAFVTSVQLGQRVYVPEPDICDWTFRRNGKIVGAETTRAMFRYATPEELAALGLDFETP